MYPPPYFLIGKNRPYLLGLTSRIFRTFFIIYEERTGQYVCQNQDNNKARVAQSFAFPLFVGTLYRRRQGLSVVFRLFEARRMEGQRPDMNNLGSHRLPDCSSPPDWPDPEWARREAAGHSFPRRAYLVDFNNLEADGFLDCSGRPP